jgi:hypothetical protein
VNSLDQLPHWQFVLSRLPISTKGGRPNGLPQLDQYFWAKN